MRPSSSPNQWIPDQKLTADQPTISLLHGNHEQLKSFSTLVNILLFNSHSQTSLSSTFHHCIWYFGGSDTMTLHGLPKKWLHGILDIVTTTMGQGQNGHNIQYVTISNNSDISSRWDWPTELILYGHTAWKCYGVINSLISTGLVD